MKIVINKCYGGYGLSRKAVDRLIELGDEQAKQYLVDVGSPEEREWFNQYYVHLDDDERSNPLLVQVVEELGEENASGDLARLKVVEIPDDKKWHIHCFDGIESIHEEHEVWD